MHVALLQSASHDRKLLTASTGSTSTRDQHTVQQQVSLEQQTNTMSFHSVSKPLVVSISLTTMHHPDRCAEIANFPDIWSRSCLLHLRKNLSRPLHHCSISKPLIVNVCLVAVRHTDRSVGIADFPDSLLGACHARRPFQGSVCSHTRWC